MPRNRYTPRKQQRRFVASAPEPREELSRAFTVDDVDRTMHPAYVARGRQYANQGLVSEIFVSDDGECIDAIVSGTEDYGVEIEIFRDRNGRIDFNGLCECPMARNCKHVAATLFAVLSQKKTPSHPEERPDPRIEFWLTRVHDIANEPAAGTLDERIAYVFSDAARPYLVQSFGGVSPLVVRRGKNGAWNKIRDTNPEALAAGNARAVLPEDALIGRLLSAYERGGRRVTLAEEIVQRIIASGHAYYERVAPPALSLGPPQPAVVTWTIAPDGSQKPELAFEASQMRRLPGPSLWYVDPQTRLAGPAAAGLPKDLLSALLDAPPIPASQAKRVSEAFTLSLPSIGVPKPSNIVERIMCVAPVPQLLIRREKSASNEVRAWDPHWDGAPHYETYAELTYGYGTATIDPAARDLRVRVIEGAESTVYERNPLLEAEVRERLRSAGLMEHGFRRYSTARGLTFAFFTAAPDQQWVRFVHETVPQLQGEGWRIDIDPSVPWRVVEVAGVEAWHPTIREAGSDWFDLALGVDVEGTRIDLLPLFARIVSAGGPIETWSQTYYLALPNSDVNVAFPAERLRAILATLLELTGAEALRDGALRLPRIRAGIIDELEAASGLRCDTPARLRTLSKRLSSFEGIKRVAVPKSFRGKLRPYQRDGLDWLQFLASYGFGGILADDMGLGKSVQTLAHVMREKEAGRLVQPVLLVVPTSLVVNWCDEAARFTPKLRVLALHGAARAARVEDISAHDLVITTYALLVRDAVFAERSWSAVILDEAQALKNPQSKAAQTAMALKAEHRLCLTGTPVENHLGDLWSLLSIAMPGLLGERKQFTTLFRTPIEKHGDEERSRMLARRVAPFLLRRTKEAVAADLPEKTEIVQRVELTGAQRDLYETVRLAMHRRVRDEIEARGLARSQIVILDALLKLRQVCCDPRLLPNARRKAVESAKLEMLLEMLVPMVEEGRRILLFSQFTSMLDLIAPAITARGISFVTLTGQTQDRATVVHRFQDREVPVFLISLRAGGTGLNLTAADTVIHYDPWWNPAVERQATDRAHRIGQTQHVFAYKLICAGTVEEKIVELQARKSELASAIFTQKASAGARFSSEDVEQLLAPIF